MKEEPRVFIWQWGKFGAGPRIAFELALALKQYRDLEVILSLAEDAELLKEPLCGEHIDFPVKTYNTAVQFAVRTLKVREVLNSLQLYLDCKRPNVAICVMPGYWDVFVIKRLQRLGIPVVMIVHDAANHPGDNFQLIQWLQRNMIRNSSAIITLSDFVTQKLFNQGQIKNKIHQTIPHPAFNFPDLKPAPPQTPKYSPLRALRLLLTGRLRKYKGVELFLQAIANFDPTLLEVRIAGSLKDPKLLARSKGLSNVTVQPGWLCEKEFISHLDWADAIILPYTEASQSGIIPTAYSRRRPVIVTPVGGLPEQVKHNITGLITQDVSVDAMAHEIQRFISEPELLKSCAEHAYEYAQNELGWECISQIIAELLVETIRNR